MPERQPIESYATQYAAIATDKSCVVLSLPRIGLDIDTPEDLCKLAKASGEKRSQVLARKLGFGEKQQFAGDPKRESSFATKS